jgi:hypothetical protein
MAVQAVHHAPSGRFIRAYLLTWGLLAAGGLTYLASLAWHPDLLSGPQRQQIAQPDPGMQAANKALAEIGTVRKVVTDIQKDLGRLKDTVDQREVEEKAAQARLAVLEERVTTMAAAPMPVAIAEPPASVAAKQRPADRRQAAAESPRAATRIITVTEAPKAAASPPKPEEPAQVEAPKVEAPKIEAPKIETGSIASPQATIVFGAPEVTPAQQPTFAVQLAAGPSLDALRLSWSLLLERHGAALSALQPRFVPPRNGGGPYRLVAGPFTSKGDADKVCAAMGVGRNGCFSTAYAGEPL